ncbi:unnamed protein product [Schistosoma rodhaini]|uniref:Serine/threonine protein kinase n=1 Tax=Schistosoma rodhaini TaxID=6188 RepID=A0A183R3A0_9TREM|nr:unnamed protein product [Schistosoma rodhaini]
MGNCLNISNHKKSNYYLSNKFINCLATNLKLLRKTHHHIHNDINARNSMFTVDLNELNQCVLLINNHKLNHNMQDLLHNEDSSNKLNFHSILNDDNDVSNDKDFNCHLLFFKRWNSILFNYYNDLSIIQNKFINYFVPIKNKKIEHTTTTTINTTNITIIKNQNNLKKLKSTYWPLINTSILGFTILKSNMLNFIEWFQYNEDEIYSNMDVNQLSMKGKQMKMNYLNKTNIYTNVNIVNNNSNNNNDDILLPIGWLRYTMFIYQTKLDTIKFLKIFHKMKYILHSIEIKTGCKILISKGLFIYKGNLIRKFVIDGPNRKQILQCYSSLPQLFHRLLILECDRPCTT